MKHNVILIIVLFSFILSCKRENTFIDRNLYKAKLLVDTYPDSALIILDSINGMGLTKFQNNEYILLKLIAKDKLGTDISLDTTVFNISKDFRKNDDIENAVLSLYYSAKIHQELKNTDSAMKYLLEAEKLSEDLSNYSLRGNIQGFMAVILLDQFLRKEAEEKLEKAIYYFQKSNDYDGEITTYLLLGNYHFYENNVDSAYIFYNRGLKMAEDIGDSVRIAKIEQNLGVLYRIEGNSKKARMYFLSALNRLIDEDEKAKIYLNLAQLYFEVNSNDSAIFYLKQSVNLQSHLTDLSLKAETYRFLVTLNENNRNYSSALDYHKKYVDVLDEIYDKELNNTVYELEKKYDYEHMQNKIILYEARKKGYILYSVLILLCISSVTLVYIIKYYRNKQTVLRTEKENLEAHNQILQLKELANSFDKNKKTFRNVLLHQFDIFRKVAFLDKLLRGNDKQGQILLKAFNEIVYKQDTLNWDMLYVTMNTLHNGFFDKIRSDYPQLDESEFKICCLIYERFSSSEIAIIMQTSIHSVHMKTTSIRKKLGIQSFGNIPEFFDKRYS